MDPQMVRKPWKRSGSCIKTLIIMEPKVKKLYKSAIKNKRFLAAIENADNDKKPNMFDDNLTKVLFATMYYGWLVAKYGTKWELYITIH